MRRLELDKNWTMKMVDGNESFDALVPGSVYGDLLSASKMEDPFWKDNEIEAITGSTITSKAMANGCNAAILYFQNKLVGGAE